MTRSQKKYYDAIRSFIETHGRSPSYSEIGRMVGVSSSCSVSRAVHRLIEQGYVSWAEGQRVGALGIVPQKMHSMNSCNRAHPPIWFIAARCPLCDILQRQTSTGKAEAAVI